MEKIKNYKSKINEFQETTDKTSEAASEVLKENPTQQIQNIAGLLFGTNDGIGAFHTYTGKPQECSNGASLYTIVKIDNKDILTKVGSGEFNTEVFNQKEINKHNKHNKNPFVDYSYIKGFSRTPIPLFVVNQRDSYLADDDKKELMKSSPKEYLENYSVIVVPKRKQAYVKGKKENIDFNNINILQKDVAIKKLQSALFESKFSQKELSEIKHTIKKRQNKTFDEFKGTINYFQKNEIKNDLIKKLIRLLNNMTVQRGDTKQMYELIKTYNINKNQFE